MHHVFFGKTICLFVMVLLVCNIQMVNMNASSIVDDQHQLLIITPEDFAENFQRLKSHKQSHGISTIIVTLSDIYEEIYFPINGRDDAEQIKYFIKNAREQWNTSYVMLVGGKDQLPVRHSHFAFSSFPTEEKMLISDLYYADIYDENNNFCSWDSNNNDVFGEVNETGEIDVVDLYPDVYIGRVLCSDLEEVDIVVNKIITYENNTQNASVVDDILFVGGDTFPSLLDELILTIAYRSISTEECRIAFEGEYICEHISKIMNDKNQIKCYASGSIRQNAERLTVSNINDAINDGCLFSLFSGHGSERGFSTHYPFNRFLFSPFPLGYTVNDINQLSNNEKLTITIFNSCLCSNFDNYDEPIAWKIINHEHGGSIASLGCTTVSWSPAGSYIPHSLVGFLTTDVFRSYSRGIDILGQLWADSITHYLDNDTAMLSIVPSLHFQHYVSLEEWILFGDPSLKIGGYE